MALSECSLDMLRYLKVRSVEELFEDIPQEVRKDGLKISPGISELDLRSELEDMMSKNVSASSMPTFLGAGVYHHFIPAAVKTIVSRGEFITSYTPYQPEISQGMLQSMFEYQSFMAELTAMDVVNSSMYDASTALGEAVLMSSRIAGGRKFLVSRAISPEKKAVAEIYAKGAGVGLVEVAYDKDTGEVNLADLKSKVGDDVCGFYFESPNFFGPIEEHAVEIREVLGARTMVVGVNPLSLALLRPPGEYGADIVVGDAQVFGSPMNLGGPMIGLFACKAEHVRKMPGRIIGMTNDIEGRRAFCMTLQTREQHIRRSKATSNICTNEALLAVAAAAYLSLVGKAGLRQIASKNVENASSLAAHIRTIDGFKAPHFRAPHFNEFVVTSKKDSNSVHKCLLSKGVHGGLVLDGMFPELGHATLYATTEMHRRADHEKLLAALRGIR